VIAHCQTVFESENQQMSKELQSKIHENTKIYIEKDSLANTFFVRNKLCGILPKFGNLKINSSLQSPKNKIQQHEVGSCLSKQGRPRKFLILSNGVSRAGGFENCPRKFHLKLLFN